MLSRAARSIFCACLIGFAAGCGGGEGSTPTAPSAAGVNFFVVFTPVGGTYSAQVSGQTYTAAGGFSVRLPAGTHEISGTFRGQGFGVGFVPGLSGGGVQSGSVQSLSGISPQVMPCSVLYSNLSTPTTERAFRVRINVTTNVNSVCQ